MVVNFVSFYYPTNAFDKKKLSGVNFFFYIRSSLRLQIKTPLEIQYRWDFFRRQSAKHHWNNWASSWENMSSGVSDQVRLKLACSATEASNRLEIWVTETRDITLSRHRTTKVLIRPRGCTGWSAPLLFLYDIRHVFSWPGSIASRD